jgi:hypothetical protein
VKTPTRQGYASLKATGAYKVADGVTINYLTPASEWAKHFAWYEFGPASQPFQKLTMDLCSGGYPHVFIEMLWFDGGQERRKDVLKIDLRKNQTEVRSGEVRVESKAVQHKLGNKQQGFIRYDFSLNPAGSSLQVRLYVGGYGEFFPYDSSSVLSTTPHFTH